MPHRARLFRLARSLYIAVASLALAAPANAGVVDGVKTVDGLTVYLGVVPAAVTRAHAPQHTESTMHGGAAVRRSIHDVHLLVAVFNRANGQRLRNVAVTARIHGTGRNLGTVPLKPMTVNGALTYGGYANFGWEEDVMILVDIWRPGRTPRTSTTTAQFEYVHD